jgi:hypothetical protein
MLAKHEETQILQGIDTVMSNLRQLPLDDVAWFLVKYNPNLAEELATRIEQNIFEKNEGSKHGN